MYTVIETKTQKPNKKRQLVLHIYIPKLTNLLKTKWFYENIDVVDECNAHFDNHF